MSIWYIETIADDTADYLIDITDDGFYLKEEYRAFGFYEAETRAKAKAKFFRQYDLEFVEPVKVRKVIDCTHCNNEGTLDYEADCPQCKGRSVRFDVK